MGTTKEFTKCSKYCALDTSRQDFQIAAIITLSLTWFVSCMRTSHAEEATVRFGAREFFKKQKHSDHALTNQMTFRILCFSSPFSYAFRVTQKSVIQLIYTISNMNAVTFGKYNESTTGYNATYICLQNFQTMTT